jgi:lipoteichoic acid synthase
MGSQLNRLGYFGQAYHNNSYTYYDRHKTHINLGYSEGFMGYGNGMEKYVKKQWPQSDLEMIQGTLPLYIDKQPFNMYYMTVSGHSNYKTSGNRIVKDNWDRVSHLECSDIIKGYFAAQLGLEDALTYLVEQLELAGIADDTVICLTTDHYPYGVKDDVHPDYMYYLKELYGYPVENYFQRDHSRLILWCGSLEDDDPIIVDEPTSVVDILPTLSNLFGLEFDSRLMPGRDVFSDAPVLVYNSHYDWKTEYGTYISKTGKFTPVVEGMEIPEDYIKAMKQIVRNKLRYCEGVLDTDYFRTLFPDAK